MGTAPFPLQKHWAKARKGDAVRNYGKVKYTKELADEMTAYFENYSDSLGAPSFEKFARLKGLTVSYLISLRRQKRFDLAYRECS
jgi:hypothetical protein